MRKYAESELINKKENHSKMSDISYSEFKMQNYLKNQDINSGQAKSLFKFRSRMVDVKCNFKNKFADLDCPLCKISPDTQEHLLKCEKIQEKNIEIKNNKTCEYKDIFKPDTTKMKETVELLTKAMKIRNELTGKE